MYHVSPIRNRASILQHGLNPDHSNVWAYDAKRGNPYPWSWTWTDLNDAVRMARGIDDIWLVTWPMDRFVPDPHQPYVITAIATRDRIAPDALVLIKPART